MPPYWVLERQPQSDGNKNQDEGRETESTNSTEKFHEIKQGSSGGCDECSNSYRTLIVTECDQIFGFPQRQFAAVAEARTATEKNTTTPSKISDDFGGDSSSSSTTVQFDLDITITHEVMGRHEYSPEDYFQTWFLPKDFERINSWNRMTVKLFRQLDKTGIGHYDDSEHCIRGLEHRLKGQNFQRTTTKTNAIYAVLMEQARQRKTPVENGPDRIAAVYNDHTYCCVTNAHERGLQDEIDAAADLDQNDHNPQSRNSALLFDEYDLEELRNLDGDNLGVTDIADSVITSDHDAESRGSETYIELHGEEKDELKTKKKGFQRFSIFFNGRRGRVRNKENVAKESASTSAVIPPTPRRRLMSRRSSM